MKLLGEIGISKERFLKIRDNSQIRLTKFYLWILGCEFKEAKECVLPNNQRLKICIFRGYHHFIGQSLPFLLIIVNEKLFSNYSKRFQDYIILHEYGHGRSLTVNVLSFLIPIFGILSTVIFLSYAIFLGINSGPYLWIVYSLLFSIIFLFITWSPEIYADFYAIRFLGLDEVILASKEKGTEEIKISKIDSIINRLISPPARLTFWLYRKVHSTPLAT
ncbi:MAG: hypothetical protein AABX40_04640 [Candidatus Hydrothermarchaeota archaeon]